MRGGCGATVVAGVLIMAKKSGSVFVVAPDGERIGPFKDREQALEFGRDKWPDLVCGDRTDGEWEIRISTRDQVTVPAEAA
jgi:hypothetical protein